MSNPKYYMKEVFVINQIYRKCQYKIYHSDDGYIVHNTSMLNFAHTHVKNYRTSIWLVDLSLRKKSPYNISRYLLESLIRINSDDKYVRKLNEILDKKNTKKEIYYNVNKGCK